MRVLVAWGSKRGGTEGIARIIGEALEDKGFEVTLMPAPEVRDASAYDAAIIGGALYANRWHRDARRVLSRNLAALRRMPVWLFSSGPLDRSAERQEIPPTPQVRALMERVGARGHATFGGRLRPDAKGFPAAMMARQHSGDWRNPERISAWAEQLARSLPDAAPGIAVEPPARSLGRLVAHGVVGWALCAAVMTTLLQLASGGIAVVAHAIAAPLIFAAVAVHYFAARGARAPLPTALTWTATVALLDAGIVAGLVLHNFAMFRGFAGVWLPLALIFLATWITGALVTTVPWPGPRDAAAGQGGAKA